YEAMTEDVAALIGSLHLSVKPHLVGHSMGGKVVMSLLLKKPALTARNIILDIAPQTYPLSVKHQRLFHFIHTADLHRFPSYTALRQHLALCFPSEREQQIILKNIIRQKGIFRWRINAEALYRAKEEIRSWQETGNCCPQEILFIKGENSPYIPDTEILKKTFPAALLSNIPQAGHWLHTEQPEKLAEIIRTYLSQPVNSRLE
ncbi:MAG: alpha/beta fold hydrolase, partial [Odoribacter sp.]|nr:alpha/beta fold hydrolase [Odoribacter sp.]